MNDFLNFSLNSLNLLDNQIYDNIKGSFVDDFIHKLQSYLELQANDKILENLPKNTNLHFAKFEDNYAVCFVSGQSKGVLKNLVFESII